MDALTSKLKHIFAPEVKDGEDSQVTASTTTLSSTDDGESGHSNGTSASKSKPIDVPASPGKSASTTPRGSHKGSKSGSLFGLGSTGSPGLSKSPRSPPGTSEQEPEHDEHKRKSLWSTLADKLGMDITRVTLPVWLSEPITSLQRAFECFECIELLDEADKCDESRLAMAYIAAFCVSGYASTSDRAAKCFNPMLGETFEYIHPKNNSRFFYEQVCHHPPVMGAIGEAEHFTLEQDSTVKTKFMGNYIDIYTLGDTCVTLKKSGHTYSYQVPLTVANNLIFGHLWLDISGDLVIKNHSTKESCTVKFTKCGWFGAGKYEVHGAIYDADGNDTGWHLDGKRNSHLDLSREGEEPLRVWERVVEEASGRFKFTPWLNSLNAADDEALAVMCCTDARLRPDRIGLEQLKTGVAVEEKSRLEVNQRRDRKARGGDENWVPRWFKQTHREDVDRPFWTYEGGYWEARQQRVDQFRAGDPVIEDKGPVNNLACDFRCDPEARGE